MAGLNKMLVIGNVGTDPEMRYTPNGNPVTSFRLATGRSYTTSDGERRQETEWFTIVAWNQLGERCNQYLAKGRRLICEGRQKSHSSTAQHGQKRIRNEIDDSANKVINLDTRIQEQQQQIAKEDLDIIFYPDIGMSSTTYFLAFSRLAPVQIVSWGHPETTGVSTIDSGSYTHLTLPTNREV